MNERKSTSDRPSLDQRARELKGSLTRLRARYRQAHLQLEMGPPRDPLVVSARFVASRQLEIMVPMYRALNALAQQGRAPRAQAKARYLDQLARATALVDRLVAWVDGSEEDYAELLDLRVPKDVTEVFSGGVAVAPLRDRMDAQRRQQEDEQVQAQGLVERLIESLTPEQRAILSRYHRVTKGAALALSADLLLDTAYS